MVQSCGSGIFTAAFVCVALCSILPDLNEARFTEDRHRHVRETTYWLDIMVLVDRATFDLWYSRTSSSLDSNQRRSEALSEIKTYFTLVIEEASKLYAGVSSSYRLNLRPVGFYINHQSSYMWIIRRSTEVDADMTLTKVSSWLKANVDTSSYDHAVLFTGDRLYSSGQGDPAGRGTLGTVCKSPSYNSVSVIEDQGAFQSVFTTAHEIGHGLNAVHDGDSNQCSHQDRYLMAADNSAKPTNTNRRNPWYFSSCSKNEIARFLGGLSQAQLDSCVGRRKAQSADVVDVSRIIPGQLYNADTQCRHLHGAESSYCYLGDLNSICTAMACRNGDLNKCSVYTAATGTSCGDRKWCQFGQCVYSPSAPTIEESCVRDLALAGTTCSASVQFQPAICYDPDTLFKCCKSCKNNHSGVGGCPYGDRRKGCIAEVHCNKIDPDGTLFNHECCDTCNFDRDSWTCEDVAEVDGVACEVAVRRNSVQGCYSPTLAFKCCQTCQKLRQTYGTTGCEYGDKVLRGCLAPVPGANSNTNSSDCDTRDCCHTCSAASHAVGQHRHHHGSFPPVLLLSVVLMLFAGPLAAPA